MSAVDVTLDGPTERVEAELFTDGGNDAVVRMPGRRFPGVLVQGDSLHIQRADAAEVKEACERGDLDEARDSAGLLLTNLDALLARYEAALREHEAPRPYCAAVWVPGWLSTWSPGVPTQSTPTGLPRLLRPTSDGDVCVPATQDRHPKGTGAFHKPVKSTKPRGTRLQSGSRPLPTTSAGLAFPGRQVLAAATALRPGR